MQFVGKVTEANLNDVRKVCRSQIILNAGEQVAILKKLTMPSHRQIIECPDCHRFQFALEARRVLREVRAA